MYKINKNIFLLAVLLIICYFILSFVQIAKAAPNDSMPKLTIPEPKLQINIPGLKFSAPTDCGFDNLGNPKVCIPWISEYIAAIYKYAIGIIGILAAVVLMFAGVLWITAGGNQTRVGEAKAWIGAALTGLVIALASYTILYQINPNLVSFSPLGISILTEKKEKAAVSTMNCKWVEYQIIEYVNPDDECKNNLGQTWSAGNQNNCTAADKKSLQSVCCCPPLPTGGKCDPVASGLCGVDNFTSWGNLAQIASAVCQAESSGQCVCNQDTWSCGPMQFHLYAGGVKDKSGTDCGDYIEKLGPGDPNKYGYAWTKYGIKTGNIPGTNPPITYESRVKGECLAKTCDPNFFPNFAYQKYQSQGWGAWSISLPGQKCYDVTH